jgi:hypothetical protein
MISSKLITLVICALYSSTPFVVRGQGTIFQNLDFESASVAASPSEFYPNVFSIGSVLPGWTAYLGADQQTQAGYNATANSTASITLVGPTWNGSDVGRYGVGIIHGNYSVDLQTGSLPNNINIRVNTSIAQNGMVPSSAESLQFDAYETTPLSVSFNGNALVPVALSSGVSADGMPYTSYGANISAWAGQTGQLEFTADFNGSFNFVVLDDITFSTNAVAVPEPNTLALILTGGLALAARRWGAKRQ